MANNCLVTKLKEVVNNDNLPYLNTVSVKIMEDVAPLTALENRYIKVAIYDISSPAKMINSGGNFLDASGNVLGKEINVTEQSPQKFFFSGDTKRISIFNKANIRQIINETLNLCNIELNTLSGCSILVNIVSIGSKQEGNISSLGVLPTLDRCTLNYTHVGGDISEIPYSKINELSVLGVQGITGDFLSWAPNREANTYVIVTTDDLSPLTCNGVTLNSIGSRVQVTFDGQGGATAAAI